MADSGTSALRGSAHRSSWAALFAALYITGCGEPAPAPVIVRDSLGITIVENHAPAWTLDSGWRVEPEPILRIAVAPSIEPDFGRVTGAARLTDGRIAILDGASHEIRFHDGESGALLHRAGGVGHEPGRLRSPGHLRVGRGDTLYVWDHPWRGLTVFDPAGGYRRTERPGRPDRIEYLFSWGPLEPPILTSARSLVTHGVFETDVAGEHLLVVARLRFEFDRTDTLITFVTGAKPVPGDRLVIAPGPADEETFVGRVTTREFRRFQSVHLRQIVRTSVQPYADTVAGQSTPRPLFSALFADRTGSVWMRLHPRAGEVDDRWVIFDRAGRELGELALPLPLDLLDVGSDYILGRDRTDQGSESVVMLRLHRG